MAIIHRYIARQLSSVFIVSYLVLALVLLAQLLSKLLSRVIAGDLALDAVWTVMVLGLIKTIALLAPFAALLSVLLVMGRLQSTSEWSSMRASGFSGLQLIVSVAYVVLPVVLIVAIAVSSVIPWANRFAEVIEVISEQTMGLQNIVPGQFLEFEDQQAVIYVQARDVNSKTLQNVFVHRNSKEGDDLEVAKSVSIESDVKGEVAFTLRDGSHYQLDLSNEEISVSKYKTHTILLPSASFEAKADRAGYQSLDALWGSDRPDYRAELWQRVSIIVSVVVLAWFALAFGVGFDNISRSLKIIIGLGVYFVYFNVIVVTTKLIEDEVVWALILQLAMPLVVAGAGLWIYRTNNAVRN